MNEDRKQKITELAKRAHAADERLNALGALNTYGLPPEGREIQAVEYALAMAEAAEAHGLLNAATSFQPKPTQIPPRSLPMAFSEWTESKTR